MKKILFASFLFCAGLAHAEEREVSVSSGATPSEVVVRTTRVERISLEGKLKDVEREIEQIREMMLISAERNRARLDELNGLRDRILELQHK